MIPCRSGSSRLLAAGFGAALLTLMTGPFGAAAQMPEATGAEIEAARALYFRGEGATAHLAGGTIALPATAFPCANCHGADGMGNQEGATVFPSILWDDLSTDSDIRPAYDAALLLGAVTGGRRSDARPLSSIMPRYDLTAEAQAGLGSFLVRLGKESQAGIGPTTLAIRPPPEEARGKGFEAAIAAFNGGGRAHGRRLVSAGPDAPAALDLSKGQAVEAAILGAELTALADAAVADGHPAVTLLGSLPDGVALAGVRIDPDAPAAILIGSDGADGAALDGKQKLYGRRDALSAGWIAAIAARPGLALAATDPFPAASDWARATGQGREGAAGYALGLVAAEAALAAGRRTSRDRLERLMREAAARPVSLRHLEAAGAH